MGKEMARDGNSLDIGDVKIKFEGSFDPTSVKSTREDIAKQEAGDKDNLPDLDSAYGTKFVHPTEAPKNVETTKPTEAPENVDGTQPTEAPKSVDATKPTEAPKNVDSTQPTEAPLFKEKPTEKPLNK